MAASPSSHLDSLYADLQVRALSVSDGLVNVVTTLDPGSHASDVYNYANTGNLGPSYDQ